MDWKYNIGDIVRIRTDLKGGVYYKVGSGLHADFNCYMNPSMMKHCGAVAKIKAFGGFGYKLDIQGQTQEREWDWCDEMLTTPKAFTCRSLL